MVGQDPPSNVYVRNKVNTAREVGIDCNVTLCIDTITTKALISVVNVYNAEKLMDGFIIQLPLPRHIDVEAVTTAINPEKDVDGLHLINQGLLLRGTPRFIPATPLGIIELLRRNNCTTSGKRIVIVGHSTIVGRPLAAALLLKGEMGDATVTIAHALTENLPNVCREAEILIVAIGKPRFITADFVRPGAVVVDVGITNVDGKLVGDVDFISVGEVASAITPVPGGVGPMTVTMLLRNTIDAC